MTAVADPIARLMSRVVENTETGCWEWTGATTKGHGVIKIGGQTRLVHRVVFTAYVGEVPDELTLDHLCRVRNCVNPSHLEVVTAAENVRRGVSANGAKTHCPKGHPYDAENTIRGRKGRHCRTCMRASQRAYKQRQRDAS